MNENDVRWEGRAHFLAVAAKTMRQVLVDHHRRRNALKRGGDRVRQPLSAAGVGLPDRDIDLLDLDGALAEFAEVDPRGSQVVELRFFGGMTVNEIAHTLAVSNSTIEGDWRHARAWLARRLNA